MTVKELVSVAKSRVENLTADQVAAELERRPVVLLDVREPAEIEADGAIAGSLPTPRGMLEFYADPESPYHLDQLTDEARVIVYCKSGSRSALSAATLTDMGFGDVAHLDGGILAWIQSQRPVVRS